MNKNNSKKTTLNIKNQLNSLNDTTKIVITLLLIVFVFYLVRNKFELNNNLKKEEFVDNFFDIFRTSSCSYNQEKKVKNNTLEGFELNLFQKKNKHYPKYNPVDNKEIYYLYWTGGYDSTFRLCEMLIDENKIVQPYYVTLVLDNDCQSEETCDKLWLRRNRNEEKKAMNEIIKTIKHKFPRVSNNILPVIHIDKPINDDKFNYEYEMIFNKVNLWPKKRKQHQYLFLSKFAYYHRRYIDIGVLGIHEKSKFAKFLNKNLIKTHDNFEVKNKDHPLGYLRFPLFGRTKEDLLYKSQINNYDDILKLTWSCWFPVKGKPCKKCPMCKERIVEHPK